ncbi:MAG: DUF3006 domain-containing protein [Ruminiclostridium sp.]|nr:DUF3006 domain-containing protein [Ruminiclostridium sp.]
MMILDRFEENYAVIESNDENDIITHLIIDRNLVSDNVNEGDVIFKKDNMYYSDENATKNRRLRVIEVLKRLNK